VDFLADQAVGLGFYTTVNKEYAQAERAKQIVDEFNEDVNLDELLQIGAREIVASGNSFWLKAYVLFRNPILAKPFWVSCIDGCH
jgi:hypothetical protein